MPKTNIFVVALAVLTALISVGEIETQSSTKGDITVVVTNLRNAEGHCFSNDVKVRFKAPKFKKARFILDGENVSHTLRMRY